MIASQITDTHIGQEVTVISALTGYRRTGELFSVTAQPLGPNDSRMRVELIVNNSIVAVYIQPDSSITFTTEESEMSVTTFITTDLPSNVAFRAETEKFIIKANYRTSADHRSIAENRKTTRVYGAMDALAPELIVLEPFAGNYGEDAYSIPLPDPDRSDADNVRAVMWDAWKRETTKVVAARLVALLAETIGEGYELPVKTPRFSQTAGCTCPCSPGFVMDVRVTHNGRPVDLWITRV